MDRRTLLKTLPMGAVAPYLAPLVARAEAEAQGKKPMRFVFVLEGNGLWPEHVMPKGFTRQEMKNPRGGDHHFEKTNGADELIDMPLGGPDGQLCESLTPLLLVGNLGGRLKTGGRFVNLPKYGAKGHATVAQFYTALLHAAGAPVNHLGM
jgi:hypothetical protein